MNGRILLAKDRQSDKEQVRIAANVSVNSFGRVT